MRSVNGSIWRHFDFLLLGSVALLVLFGITMIRSTIAGNIELEELNIVGRQLVFAIGGFVVVFLVASIDYHTWSSTSRSLYFGTILVLLVLNVVGAALFGSARWFRTALVFIQPSELAKVTLILVLADYFTRHRQEIHDLRIVAKSFIYTMGIVFWVLVQPNLSTSIVMLVLWFALLWAAGLKLQHLALFIVLGAAAPVVGFPFMEEYQQRRVLNFLFPDPEARYGDIYNLQQALITIGSGGWFGQGLGHGSQVQNRFLKVRHTDFIFSAMAEEFGFIGTVLVIAVLIFVVFRCLRAARMSRDTYGALICYGVATMITFQSMVNIGVNLNMLPATGLTLPFISYGGSSLLSILLGIGLVESVIARHRALEF
jgi:rod shape determining protein RodA